MKTIGKVILNKTLFVILTIAVMLFSNFAPIISWAVENNETTEQTEDEYVKFDLTWADNTTEITSDAGIVNAKFSLQFNTLENFSDFKIQVERTDRVKVSYENNGQYFDNASSASQIQYLKEIPGGTRIEGTINFEFLEASDFQRYQKNLVVKLIGTYELNGEEINVELSRSLIANIITPPETTYHQLELGVESTVREEKQTSSNTSQLYVVSELTQTFYINYKFVNSEYQKFEFNIYRTASNNNNVYYPDVVTFSDTSFSLTKVDNGDGTYKYIAEKGAEHQEYEKNNILDYERTASVSAKYIIGNAAEDVATTGKIYVTLISKGYNVTTSESGAIGEKTTLQKTGSNSKNTGIHSETSGFVTWGNSYIDTSENAQTSYTKGDIEEFLQKDKMEVSYNTNISYVSGTDNFLTNTTVTQNSRKIEYYDYEGSEYKSNYCTEDSMHVKTIEVSGMKRGNDVWIKFYKQGESEPFFTATADDLIYTAPENEIIGDYYAVLSKVQINRYTGWKTTYEISASSLKNDGLTEEDVRNIRTIGVQQRSNGSFIYTKKEEATYYIIEGNIGDISAFSIDIENANLNANSSEVATEIEGEIKLKLNNDRLFENNKNMFMNIKNTNPTFYIELPKEYKFDIDKVDITDVDNRLKIKSYEIKKYNEKKVLIIKTEGQASSIDASVNINYKRSLNASCTSQNGTLKVYMITDEGTYFNSAEDINDYNEDGNNSDKIGYAAVNYVIGYNSQIQIQNNLYSASNELKSNENVKLEPGKTVKYAVTLNNDNNTIRNISIVSRLPFIGNKSIIGNNLIDLGTTVSLENLKNIEVYEKYNEQEIKLDSTNYEISYSSEETANFDTTFDTSESGISTAKTLKIKMSDSYRLYKGNALIVKYELDIPTGAVEGQIASQTSAVKYIDNENNEQTIEGVKSNVVVGSSAGTIEIVKQFEGENNLESVENIEFKITNVDDTTKYYTGTTNASGHVVFTNIPVGDYEITELTEFENYEAIAPQYVTISNGEEYTEANRKSILFENKMKMTKIEISKTWEDTNDIQSNDIEFEIQGTTVNGEERTIKTTTYTEDDEEGNKIQKALVFVPYGSYVIKETKGEYGWHAEDVNIEANQETIVIDIENRITKGNIEIIKTVPEGETVEGLTFRITGIGDISYRNKEGTEVLFEKDMEIQIEEDNENIEISEDKRTANITIPNMPVGTYRITEINMPKVDTESGEVTRYVNVIKTVKVPDVQGETVSVPIENKHKTGNLYINKTVTEGADLEDFRVRVSGTSYYGNTIYEEYDVPASGKIRCEGLEIGNYKVEECNTKEINGKIYTTDPDGFEVTYSPEGANTSGVEIQYARTTTVNIHNEYKGKGIVRIEKSLEGETDASKAKGIEFAVVGKDLVGNDVNKTITIGEDGTGTSNPIPVGTYLLSEIESTVPDIYDIVEDQEITVKTENTEENPLILPIENKLTEGKIIMETETVTGGYPPSPVTYEVTKVDDNLQAMEEPVEVVGDNKSKAELTNLKGGKYLVKQKVVPEGYKKDDDQIVKVTRDSMGYALFIIDKDDEEEFDDTTVKIQKEILNKEGETATTEDFIKSKLEVKESYSFEVKLKNTETNQIYYSFVENNKVDVIQGLPYGTYEVEEIYKPKYKMLEVIGENVIKDEETGRYAFTLSSTKKKIEFTIKNQIDTNFGFGGQDSKDNLSKILVEEVEQIKITKARIYVRDEEDNKISNAEFKLYNEQGELLKLAGNSGEYAISEEGDEIITPKNGMITLKALPIGNYKLVNESVSSDLLKADDKIVTVYQDAVGITRIELLRNIPRGNLRLSTTYVADSGETKYVPKSKYKILNTTTEEILTFTKKADGTYYRSNLPNAVDTITLRAGYVDVQGIEAGIEYHIGLVDLTEKYGVEKEEPEIVNIQEGERDDVNVSVKERAIKFQKVVASRGYTIALDTNGNIWYGGDGYGPSNRNRELKCINEVNSSIENVKFKDLDDINWEKAIAIDENGKVWYLTFSTYYDFGCYVRCINEEEGNPLHNENIKMKKISCWYGDRTFTIDEQGKVWFWDETSISGSFWPEGSRIPVCISETTDLKDVNITDICIGYEGNQVLAIDINGKLWSWGRNISFCCGVEEPQTNNQPTCISDIENSRIKDKKIKRIATGEGVSFAIDTENKLWCFGNSKLNLKKDDMNEEYWNPICLNENDEYNIFYGIGIKEISCTYKTALAIDEIGRLWSWGQNDYGILGTYENSYERYVPSKEFVVEPNCITEMGSLKAVSSGIDNIAAAIDENGDLWIWGNKQYIPIQDYPRTTSIIKPTKVKISKKSHFDIQKFVKVEAGVNSSIALDDVGRVWSWGSGEDLTLGIGYLGDDYGRNYKTSTQKLVGGYYNLINNEKIVDIALHKEHALALDSEGKVWAWGNGSYFGAERYIFEPICLTRFNKHFIEGKKIKKIATSYNNSMFIDEDGKLYIINYYSSTTEFVLNDKINSSENVQFVDVKGFGTSNYQKDPIIALDSDGNIWSLNSYDADPQKIDFNGIKITSVEGPRVNNTDPHFLAIDEDGDLWVWGHNAQGQLGYGPSEKRTEPLCLTREDNILNGKKIVKVSAGAFMSMAVDEQGNIYTWGSNSRGQLGHNTGNPAESGIECINKDNGLKIQDMSIGDFYCLAVDENGEIWSWGSKTYVLNSSVVPLKLNGTTYKYTETILGKYENISDYKNVDTSLKYKNSTDNNKEEFIASNIKQQVNCSFSKGLYSGYGYAYMMLDNDGNLWSYGENNIYGVLGDGTTNSWRDPKCINYMFGNKKIEEIIALTQVSSSGETNGIIKDIDGNIWIWGSNTYGQCGTGTTDTVLEPICINDFTVEKIVSKGTANIVQDTEGRIWSWGYNAYGQCGTGTTENVLEPTNINENNEIHIEKIILSGMTNIIQDTEGRIWSWGYNYSGLCGTGTTDAVLEPMCINETNMFQIKEIINETYNTIEILDTEGNIWTWGYNILEPEKINDDFLVDEVITTGNTNIIQDTEGKIWTWGQNTYGQCGTGTTENVLEPTCISEGKFTVEKVILSGNTNIIQDAEGKIWTWGQNTYGQCGTETTENVLEPTCINEETPFIVEKNISLGNTIILQDTEGKIWTWGQNTYGQCGTGTTDTVLGITCINEETPFTIEKIISSKDTIILQDTEGRIWTWGSNSVGQCGTGTTDSVSGITCINESKFIIKEIIEILPEYDYFFNMFYPYRDIGCIIVQDIEGKIWTWGQNLNGQCGTGTTDNVLEPTCINSENPFTIEKIIYNEFKNVSGYIGRSIILQDTEGRIWSWGENKYGECGTGTTESVLEPTCINSENPFTIEKIIYNQLNNTNSSISNSIIVQDTEGRIWTWGQNTNGQCGTGIASEISGITCINEETQMDLRESNIVITDKGVLVINKNNEAWAWTSNAKPTKINTIGKINGRDIKEIAKALNGEFIALTNEGEIYIISSDLKSAYGEGDLAVVGTYGTGPWVKDFVLLHDSKY